MKKKLFMVVWMVASMTASAFPAAASRSADDFRVVKNAVGYEPEAVRTSATPAAWIKVLVAEKVTGKEKVKLTLPLSFVEMIAGCAGDKFHVNPGCQVELKKILEMLRKSGPRSLVEVEEEDELVKIWIE